MARRSLSSSRPALRTFTCADVTATPVRMGGCMKCPTPRGNGGATSEGWNVTDVTHGHRATAPPGRKNPGGAVCDLVTEQRDRTVPHPPGPGDTTSPCAGHRRSASCRARRAWSSRPGSRPGGGRLECQSWPDRKRERPPYQSHPLIRGLITSRCRTGNPPRSMAESIVWQRVGRCPHPLLAGRSYVPSWVECPR